MAWNYEARPGGPSLTWFEAIVRLTMRLRRGDEVRASEIEHLLTKAEWRRFQLAVHGPEFRWPKTIRDGLAEYLRRLADADRLMRAAEAEHRRDGQRGGEIHRDAEAAYEHALEALREAVDDHPGVVWYLHPQPDLARGDAGSELSREGMPRLIKWNRARMRAPYCIGRSGLLATYVCEFLEELGRSEFRKRTPISGRGRLSDFMKVKM